MRSQNRIQSLRKAVNRKAGAFGLLLILAMVPAFTAQGVWAIPSMPYQLYGNVVMNGAPAVPGTSVKAKIGDYEFASTVTDVSGRYGYSPSLFRIPADDPATPTIEGGAVGDTVQIFVAGMSAGTATFITGRIDNKDLAVVYQQTPTTTPPPETTTPPPDTTTPPPETTTPPQETTTPPPETTTPPPDTTTPPPETTTPPPETTTPPPDTTTPPPETTTPPPSTTTPPPSTTPPPPSTTTPPPSTTTVIVVTTTVPASTTPAASTTTPATTIAAAPPPPAAPGAPGAPSGSPKQVVTNPPASTPTQDAAETGFSSYKQIVLMVGGAMIMGIFILILLIVRKNNI